MSNSEMKRLRLVGAGFLLLLFWIAAPIYAMQQQDKDKQQQGQNKRQEGQNKHQPQGGAHAQRQQGQPQQNTQQPRPSQQREHVQKRQGQQQERAQEQQHRAQQQQGQQRQRAQQQQSEQRGVWQQHRAHSWQAEHRTWGQRGGYNGYRIPDDRFRVSFGSVHRFRIHALPVLVVGGYPRFQYGGFWFGLVDPWPEYWTDNWYETDDVYIDYYDDGYYLYNHRHPGVRIAINVFVG